MKEKIIKFLIDRGKEILDKPRDISYTNNEVAEKFICNITSPVMGISNELDKIYQKSI